MASNFLVITGPSGAGKSTIIQYLLRIPLFEFSISYTTRPIRIGEIHGMHYFFINENDFQKKIDEGFFIEYTKFNGCYYGTPRNGSKGKIMVLDIEIDGLDFFKKNSPESFFCLVTIDKDEMERRLLARMQKESDFKEEDFKKRMNSYDTYSRIEKKYGFNRIIDNSKGIEETAKMAEILADDVIDYYRSSPTSY